ncbi:threonine/serine exporter family protein [Niveibacterium sp. 24ML]|uniref:threonine/serine ThrE exporter family protein n=1 Tax=Niveibacterium sp. 24ML TaxID=2985512 RepID=UPI0022707EF2|nr:threonine/serine exporter family protein [Niveibacterium sp. 24ML]MCX9155516.1 threonine/serine exporter family protein [Niveibacterium sp. 24ML]
MTTASSNTPDIGSGIDASAAMRFLLLAARLLLEYNMRSELLRRKLLHAAHHLGVEVLVFVSYRGVTLFSPQGRQFHAQAPELRINVAVSTRVNRVIDDLCERRIDLPAAIAALESVERTAGRHNRWLLALIFGVAAAALARLLHADWGAVAVSGVSSGLGLLARQALAKRHVVLFALPFTAALIGSLLGGLVIRLGWTETPGFCLMVPALMLVPGPHLINGMYDMIENHMQTGISRLGLATGILVGAALGVFLGGWLTLGMSTVAAVPAADAQLTLLTDVLLAGLAACGFGAFYNEPWRVLWVSVLCGMVGHGIRYVAMEHGIAQEIATLFACLAIGGMANVAVDRLRVPFAAVAFAGAVPMMPGVFIYQGIAGAMQIAREGSHADAALLAGTFACFFKAVFIVGAMGLGLLIGARMAGLLRRPRPSDSSQSDTVCRKI